MLTQADRVSLVELFTAFSAAHARTHTHKTMTSTFPFGFFYMYFRLQDMCIHYNSKGLFFNSSYALCVWSPLIMEAKQCARGMRSIAPGAAGTN